MIQEDYMDRYIFLSLVLLAACGNDKPAAAKTSSFRCEDAELTDFSLFVLITAPDVRHVEPRFEEMSAADEAVWFDDLGKTRLADSNEVLRHDGVNPIDDAELERFIAPIDKERLDSLGFIHYLIATKSEEIVRETHGLRPVEPGTTAWVWQNDLMENRVRNEIHAQHLGTFGSWENSCIIGRRQSIDDSPL